MVVPQCLAGRYELRRLLGSGGMGTVYEGWDRRLERTVAVKLLNEELARHSDIRQRFELEARAAAMLVNPKVVAVYDTGEHEGIPYIVMERLPGRTLADELAAGPIPQHRVRAILLDMLEAVAAAHDAGVIHRDIKPSNVLLTGTGSAKIADFGIAKSTEHNLTQTGTLVGTAAYLSPERVMGLPAGPQSDIYSVAIVGFEALSGRAPFQADTPLGLIRAITDDPVPALEDLVPGIDPSLAAAIARATRKKPEERFDSARAMAAALGHPPDSSVVSALPTTQAPSPYAPTAVVRIERPTSSTRAMLIGAALLLLLVVMVVFNRRGDPSPPAVAGPDPTPADQKSPSPAGLPLAGVRSVDFLGPGTLVVTRGPGSLKIEAPAGLLNLVTKQVSGARLTLGLPAGSGTSGAANVVYRLTLNRLQELQASGGGTVSAEGISEPSFKAASLGSADLTVTGKADALELSLAGSGSFDGSRLMVSRAVVDVVGSGGARLNVAGRLSARLAGSGSVEYTGNPEVSQSTLGSGRVRKAAI